MFTFALPLAAVGHEAVAPSKIELVNELRGINAELRAGQTLLDQGLIWDRSTSARAISQAQIAFFAEDYAVAAGRLLKLVARPGFEKHPGYPEALSYLGEAFVQLGLKDAGVRHLRDALGHPGQSPTQFRLRFARYLELATEKEDLGHARRLWRKFQTLRPAGPLEKHDREARYQYAKVLFRGGALAEAESLFDAVDIDDARFLQARYFIGVLALSRGEQLKAKAAFDEALAEWRQSQPQREKTWLAAVDESGPDREVLDLVEDLDAEAADVAEAEEARMGAVIQLAVARLATATGNHAYAWQNYRGVPPGDPDFAAALYEASYVLFKRDEHAWCVRVVDQLLAARGDDVSAATLALWRGQLLARSGRFDAARGSYVALKKSLDRRVVELEADINESRRLFAPAVLAWSAPNDANRARRLEAELVGQREALLEASEIAEMLQSLAATQDLLPATRQGRRLHAQLTARLMGFQTRLAHARAEAHPEGDELLHGGGIPASPADVQRIEASSLRLKQRIERFERQLVRFETAYRKRIASVLGVERPKLTRLKRQLANQTQSAERLALAMRGTARQNLESYAAEALFGQVDLVWWRKQEVSDRVNAAHRARNAEILKISEDMPEPTSTDESTDEEPEEEQQPGDEPDQLAQAAKP